MGTSVLRTMMYEKNVMTPMMVAPAVVLDWSPSSPAMLPGMKRSHGRISWNTAPYEFSHSPAQIVHRKHRPTRKMNICNSVQRIVTRDIFTLHTCSATVKHAFSIHEVAKHTQWPKLNDTTLHLNGIEQRFYQQKSNVKQVAV